MQKSIKSFFMRTALSVGILLSLPLQAAASLADIIIDDQQRPTKELVALLDFLHIQHVNTLASIVADTQKKWLRTAGKERWQVAEKFPEKREQILRLCDGLHMIKAIRPVRREYDCLIVLGATVHRVRARLAYTVQLWQQGIRWKKLIFLGGMRPLDPDIESAQFLLDHTNKQLAFIKDWQLGGALPATEIDMMRLVYEQSALPHSLRALPTTFISAPMQIRPDGSMQRPSTGETIWQWVAKEPQSGSCLFVSNQPFIGYQDAVARTYMPGSYYIETIGPEARKNISISSLLDNCARWLYQENKRLLNV